MYFELKKKFRIILLFIIISTNIEFLTICNMTNIYICRCNFFLLFVTTATTSKNFKFFLFSHQQFFCDIHFDNDCFCCNNNILLKFCFDRIRHDFFVQFFWWFYNHVCFDIIIHCCFHYFHDFDRWWWNFATLIF